MEELALDPSPKVTRKNLNILHEFETSNLKKSSSFVVIGHVDHGKSTLMGRLLYDLKFVTDKTMRGHHRDAGKIGKGAFAYAWVMDSSTDERERGVTVDIAMRNFETEKTNFTILDAPGHQDFIPNMIAGTGQADFALLVIDAGVNGFESGLRGQTKEHAILARSMGIQRLIVVVNKMDKAEWSQERFNEIQTLMSAFLITANYKKSAVQFVPCAGLTGENITQRPDSESAKWYTGPTLVEALDGMESSTRAIEKPLRMVISELVQTNTVSTATGKISSGSLQVGDSITIQPASQTATIRSIEFNDEVRDWAVAGQNITVRLIGIDPAHVQQGDIICSSSDVIPNVTTFTAKILALEHIIPMYVEIHHGRMQVSGKIARLVATLDKETGRVVKKTPKMLQPGAPARVDIELESSMPLEGKLRIVLRAEGRTIAAGVVE